MLDRLDPRHVVVLLDEDRDLATGLDPEELAEARARALATVLELEPPSWDTSSLRRQADPGWLGLFVLNGLLIRRVNVGRRSACELFGPGDLIRPWDTDGEYDPLPISVEWLVVKRSRLALLDSGFMLRTARWPTINGRIVGRISTRARYLALIQAVTHLPRAFARLLILFWLLAERWGRVGPDGVHVTLPLTHEILAMLIGAHRPTVTIALQRLSRCELLIREATDRWLLTNAAIESLAKPDALGIEDDREDEDEGEGEGDLAVGRS